MRLGLSAWAAALLSCGVAHGFVNEGAVSRRGLAIKGEYLLSLFTTEENCAKIREAVDELKSEFAAGAALRGVASRDIPVLTACTVSFSAEEELYEYIKTNLPGKLADIPEASDIVFEQDTVVEPLAAKSWGLDRIDQRNLPLSNQDITTGLTGNGVEIYVIDTGVNAAHVDFGGRATLARDFSGEGLQDLNGHGTHCSGTAAGGSYGIARSAKVIGVKVLGQNGGSNQGVINGVNYAVQSAGNKAAVLSMSLGGGASTALDNAVKAAAQKHIVVVAAGNENQNACNVSPARAGGNGLQGSVVTVGSTTITDGMSSFSNYGACTDIFAPGSQITSAWIGSTTATNTISGTSMATPHVAGVAAVLLEKHNGNKANAQNELLTAATPNKITGIGPQSPNKLLYIGAAAAPGTPVAAPTPAPAPVTAPTPATQWTCPAAWRDSNDGCDCECGEIDPDCLKATTTRLYCRGRAARYWQICDGNTNTCVSRWGMLEDGATPAPSFEDGLENKDGVENGVEYPPPILSDDPAGTPTTNPDSSSMSPGVIIAAIGGASVLIAAVAFTVVRRRRAEAEQQKYGQNHMQSYVGSPQQHF